MKHNDLKCVQGEGMPVYREPFDKGQLFVQFQVRFLEDTQRFSLVAWVHIRHLPILDLFNTPHRLNGFA